MPTYDFICEKCGHKFSVFCSVSSRDKQVCPQCANDKISQRFTTVNAYGVKGGKACSSGKCSPGCKC
ncbi:FmdB family zinc ribbon protein [Dehalobacter restrictus]|uniref:Zinc ribbon domain-containing protein n=1 Tax=Dehalobacter restrictus TaxID=55583 RepID=A0A857DJU8_9FIRM|nr:zinc ribbon domain-containing protein [Dehalobacter restrictus]QHA00991.1 zinc ribbon domain-containing protein [Dehalobacter restrictus]